jgi:putative hemolysin
MHLLWSGLADYVLERGIEILFGAASFPGTDPDAVGEALALLHHRHLAPPELRARAWADARVEMDRANPEAIDAARAMQVIPSLIKAYLRLGGAVGDGAYIDHDFNTIDVCVVMDTARMAEKHRAFYARRRGVLA